MTRKRRIALLTFFIGSFLNIFGVKYAPAASNELQQIDKMEEEVKPRSFSLVRPKIEYKAGDLRDPFKGAKLDSSAAGPDVNLSKFTIQGIVWGGSFPQAIINGKVVKIGDTLEGVKVIDVNKDGVTIFSGGQQYKLSSPAATDLLKAEEKRKGGTNEKK